MEIKIDIKYIQEIEVVECKEDEILFKFKKQDLIYSAMDYEELTWEGKYAIIKIFNFIVKIDSNEFMNLVDTGYKKEF